jgi:hypothetical protein
MNDLLPVLLRRCEESLKGAVPDGSPNASDTREEVLGQFGELFAIDGSDEDKLRLDYFECRFNRAFRALRLSVWRKDTRRAKRFQPLPDIDENIASDDARLCHLSAAFIDNSAATQQKNDVHAKLRAAVEALPPEEREAVSLVYFLGYDVESEDPRKETAATRAKVTGRTIRNRLARAEKTLSEFMEAI